jgi:predicted nucleic acid-binding protein
VKVFLDTNVLIAACLTEHEHHERAWPLVNSVREGKVEGFASAHAVLEVYAILTRLPRSPRLSTLQVTALIEENILEDFNTITLSGKEYGELVLKLGREGISGGQAYDALHLACAWKGQVDRVYTFNARHFQRAAEENLRERIMAP